MHLLKEEEEGGDINMEDYGIIRGLPIGIKIHPNGILLSRGAICKQLHVHENGFTLTAMFSKYHFENVLDIWNLKDDKYFSFFEMTNSFLSSKSVCGQFCEYGETKYPKFIPIYV